MPRVDRGGGREGKKSLRKNKQKKYEDEKTMQKPVQVKEERPLYSPAAPPISVAYANQLDASVVADDSKADEQPNLVELSPAVPGHPFLPLVDCGCNLLSRQFDRDLNAVLTRGTRSGVMAVIAQSTDFAKQAEVCTLSRQNAGLVFAMIGISPDIIKRANDKLFVNRLAEIKDLALTNEVVALSAGLDLTRELGTHFLQLQLLEAQLALAHQIRLPVCLRVKDLASAEKVMELIRKLKSDGVATPIPEASADDDDNEAQKADVESKAPALDASPDFVDRYAIYGFAGSEEELRMYLSADCYIMLSGQHICDSALPEAAPIRTMLPLIPLNRLLLMTDAPGSTPQVSTSGSLRFFCFFFAHCFTSEHRRCPHA